MVVGCNGIEVNDFFIVDGTAEALDDQIAYMEACGFGQLFLCIFFIGVAHCQFHVVSIHCEGVQSAIAYISCSVFRYSHFNCSCIQREIGGGQDCGEVGCIVHIYLTVNGDGFGQTVIGCSQRQNTWDGGGIICGGESGRVQLLSVFIK